MEKTLRLAQSNPQEPSGDTPRESTEAAAVPPKILAMLRVLKRCATGSALAERTWAQLDEFLYGEEVTLAELLAIKNMDLAPESEADSGPMERVCREATQAARFRWTQDKFARAEEKAESLRIELVHVTQRMDRIQTHESSSGPRAAEDIPAGSLAVVGAGGVLYRAKRPGARPEAPKILSDAQDAAWRTAGSQLVKLTKNPFAALLSQHLSYRDEAVRMRIDVFLRTELGEALFGGMLSLALGAIPEGLGEAPQRLARELRVAAMAQTADTLADLLTGPLREILATTLRGVIPTAPPEAPHTPVAQLGEAGLRTSFPRDPGEPLAAASESGTHHELQSKEAP